METIEKTKIVCVICGGEYILKKNGTHTIDNLCLACLSCNSSKRDKLPAEWDAYRVEKLGHILDGVTSNEV
jgi:hypothetical protein